MTVPHGQARALLTFGFVETSPRQWFAKDPAFDQAVRDRFTGLTRSAIAGEQAAWGEDPASALALVLVLDQFTRQIWRDSAMAFAGDPQALALSRQGVELHHGPCRSGAR